MLYVVRTHNGRLEAGTVAIPTTPANDAQQIAERMKLTAGARIQLETSVNNWQQFVVSQSFKRARTYRVTALGSTVNPEE